MSISLPERGPRKRHLKRNNMQVAIDPSVLAATKSPPSKTYIVPLTIKENTLQLDSSFSAETVDELGKKLTQNSPAFVFIQYQFQKNGRSAYPCCLLYFNPPQIPVQTAMIYSRNIQHICKELRCQGTYSTRDCDEITDEEFQEWLNTSFMHY